MHTNSIKEIEGLVIRSFAYGEYDKILHIFTPDEGVIHLIAKGAMRPKKMGSLSIEPLTLATFYLKQKPHNKLFQCVEAVPSRLHSFLRRRMDKLDCACRMAMSVAQTQMSNQPAPLLFSLLCYYLKKLETSENTASILASFQLKLLRHDGVLSFPARCCVCEANLSKFWFYEDLAYCQSHAPAPAGQFDENEVHQLALLTMTTEFTDIESMNLPVELPQKICLFFKGHTKQAIHS